MYLNTLSATFCKYLHIRYSRAYCLHFGGGILILIFLVIYDTAVDIFLYFLLLAHLVECKRAI